MSFHRCQRPTSQYCPTSRVPVSGRPTVLKESDDSFSCHSRLNREWQGMNREQRTKLRASRFTFKINSHNSMIKKLQSRHAAFTLVEIMIVVAIIALLAAIAVPGFLRARKRSQASK